MSGHPWIYLLKPQRILPKLVPIIGNIIPVYRNQGYQYRIRICFFSNCVPSPRTSTAATPSRMSSTAPRPTGCRRRSHVDRSISASTSPSICTRYKCNSTYKFVIQTAKITKIIFAIRGVVENLIQNFLSKPQKPSCLVFLLQKPDKWGKIDKRANFQNWKKGFIFNWIAL